MLSRFLQPVELDRGKTNLQYTTNSNVGSMLYRLSTKDAAKNLLCVQGPIQKMNLEIKGFCTEAQFCAAPHREPYNRFCMEPFVKTMNSKVLKVFCCYPRYLTEPL